MKKRIVCLMATCLLGVSLLAGCGSSSDTTGTDTSAQDQTSEDSGNKTIEKLNVAFVPSKDPDEIITATEPLKDMLKTELGKEGYDVGEVDITVGTSYEAVGEALSAGTADVGLIPGGTYVLYDDGCDVLLTATRDGLNKDSDNAKDWNDGKPTEKTADQVVSYRALIIAGPSEKGQELAEKVNNGEELTWDDLNSANWSVMNSTSPAGYIYSVFCKPEAFARYQMRMQGEQSQSALKSFTCPCCGKVYSGDNLRCPDCDLSPRSSPADIETAEMRKRLSESEFVLWQQKRRDEIQRTMREIRKSLFAAAEAEGENELAGSC